MIHSMMIVRNEEGRWLEKVLQQQKEISDRLIVLDDCSTDNTFDICLRYANMTYQAKERKWHNKEYELRQELWDITTEKAKDGDIIICFDADELIDDLELFKKELKHFENNSDANGIIYRLYDMWSDTHYRDDQYWKAHKGIWGFVVRYDKSKEQKITQKNLHCGRFPYDGETKVALSNVKIKHMGWSREEDRKKKYERYMKNDPCGEFGWIEQYQSILYEKPNLVEFGKQKKILLCAPVHEKEKIFKEYIKALRDIEVPEDCEIVKLFVLHNSEHLSKHLDKGKNEYYKILNDKVNYKKEERTHIWEQENFNAVVGMKNYLLDVARNESFDYIFYVDSDLILHKKTLNSLINADKDIISEVFWTKWDNSNNNYPEMPNSWLFDQYGMNNEFINTLSQKKDYFRVGMTGACALIKRKVFEEKFVNWNPIHNISYSSWEDRSFCIRAAAAGFEIWTDTNYPAIHLYREEEYEKFVKGGGINE